MFFAFYSGDLRNWTEYAHLLLINNVVLASGSETCLDGSQVEVKGETAVSVGTTDRDNKRPGLGTRSGDSLLLSTLKFSAETPVQSYEVSGPLCSPVVRNGTPGGNSQGSSHLHVVNPHFLKVSLRLWGIFRLSYGF